jgi:hypothetical protein
LTEFSQKRAQFAVKNIKDYPPGLDELYTFKLSKVLEHDKKYPKIVGFSKDVLIATSYAYRPLSLSELEALLPWSGGDDDVLTTVTRCQSFLTLKDQTILLNHKSATDFLLDNHSRLQGGSIQGHADMAKRSIEAMEPILERDVYRLKKYGPNSKPIQRPNPDPLGPIAYSCVYWTEHFCSLDEDVLQDSIIDLRLLNFLEKRFLYWLESLSLLGKLSSGVESIRKLLFIAQVYYNITVVF